MTPDLGKLAVLLGAKTDPGLLEFLAGRATRLLEVVGSDQPTPQAQEPGPRWQDVIIASLIDDGASVLDLGCGKGELLATLIRDKHVRGQGVELEPEEVLACVDRGIPVFQADIDEGLKGFPDHSFDVVVLEETLQTLRRPVAVLEEILRVGQVGIVSFPNFGYWRIRLDLAVRGRMPMSDRLPHRWYNTPNLHLFSLQDLLDWCASSGTTVVSGMVLAEGAVRPLDPSDNLYAEEALLVLTRPLPGLSSHSSSVTPNPQPQGTP